MEPPELGLGAPYGASPNFGTSSTPPRRQWWHARKRDLFCLVALACGIVAALVRDAANAPGQIVVVGPLYDSQIWLPLAMLAVLAGGAWVISRAWMGGGSMSLRSTFLAAIVTVATGVACLSAGLAVLLGLLLSTSSDVKDFRAPGSDEHFVLLTFSPGDYISYTVYRGGPWTYRELYPDGQSFSVDYSTNPPVLVYPNGDGQARMPVPVG